MDTFPALPPGWRFTDIDAVGPDGGPRVRAENETGALWINTSGEVLADPDTVMETAIFQAHAEYCRRFPRGRGYAAAEVAHKQFDEITAWRTARRNHRREKRLEADGPFLIEQKEPPLFLSQCQDL